MFKISEFSQLGQISVKTLRYYDQLGLLKPAQTDPLTGYRYYTAAQLLRLNRILAFKELGFTLEQIIRLLDEQVSAEQIRGMFRLKQAEIQTLIEEEEARLLRLEGRLCQIERESGALPPHEVILKRVEPQLVLSFRQQTSPAVIPQMHAELQQQLQHAGLTLTSYLVIWHGCEDCDDAMDLEVACPIPQAISGKHHLRVQTLAAEPTVASILHPCEPQHVCPASLELAGWIEANHYQMASNHPRREVYLTPEAGGLYIAEVQIPVQSRN